MGLAQITLRLPPRGLLVRDLVVTAISPLLKNPIVKSIRNEGDKIVVEVPLGSEGHFLNQMFQTSHGITKSKLGLMPSPRLIGNDVNIIKVFQKETKQAVSKDSTLLRFALQVLDWAQRECYNSTSKFLTSYNSIQERPSELVLGGREYAALQLFKVEKYEYGKDFLRGYEDVKMQIRHDVCWLALLMAGLSLAYSGMVGGELVLITVPEDFVLHGEELKGTMHLFFSLPESILYDKDRGPSLIASRIGIFDPAFAFLQLLSYALVREWYGDFDFDLLSQAPIQVYRVRVGRAHTLVERNIADLAPFTRFAYKLLKCGADPTLKRIENLLRNYYGLDYSRHYSISMKLYQAVSGSYDVYSLVYELGRLLTPGAERRVFSEEDVMAIINVLTTQGV